MKLGLYDKAMEDYAKLEELGVNMSEDGASESSQQDESSSGGTYVWTYTDENGTIKELITVQSGSSRMSGVADYPPEQMSDMAASMIATQNGKKNIRKLGKHFCNRSRWDERGADGGSGNNIRRGFSGNGSGV